MIVVQQPIKQSFDIRADNAGADHFPVTKQANTREVVHVDPVTFNRVKQNDPRLYYRDEFPF